MLDFILELLIKQYLPSLIIGNIVVQLVGYKLSRRIILTINLYGFGFSITIGATLGWIIKLFIGL